MSVGAVNKQTGDRIPTAGMTVVDSVLSGSSTNPVQNRVVKAALDGKVDAESGKGLSTNDYTNTDKAKVAASLNVFTGTQAEWAELSTAEKKAYQRADFTDDYDPTAIGNMTDLHTSTKSSIVGAINEVADGKQNATDNNLQTTSKTIVGGINEVKSGLTDVNSKITCDLLFEGTPSSAETFETVNLSAGVSNYKMIMFLEKQYSNVSFSLIEPRALFDVQTNSGSRVIINNANTEVYKVSDTSVSIKMARIDNDRKTAIYGLLK